MFLGLIRADILTLFQMVQIDEQEAIAQIWMAVDQDQQVRKLARELENNNETFGNESSASHSAHWTLGAPFCRKITSSWNSYKNKSMHDLMHASRAS